MASMKKLFQEIASASKQVGQSIAEKGNNFYVQSPKFGNLDFENVQPSSYSFSWDDGTSAKVASTYNIGGEQYFFVPEDVILKGVKQDKYQIYSPAVLNKDNIKKLYETSELVDLGTDIKTMIPGSKGFLMKADTFTTIFPSLSRYTIGSTVGKGGGAGEIQGLGEIKGNLVYVAQPTGRSETAWIQPSGTAAYDGEGTVGSRQIRYVKKGGGLLGDLGRAIASVPLLPEIAGVITQNPYVYAGLKGLALGAQGVDPLQAGLQVGATIYATNMMKSPDFTKDIGKAVLGSTVTDATASIVGSSLVGGTTSAVIAATTGGDVGKSFLAGATASGVMTGSGEVANALIGKENVASIAQTVGLDVKVVENIIARSVVDGAIAAANGQDFVQAAATSMAAGGLGAKASQQVTDALRNEVGVDTLKGIGVATNEIVRTGSTAAIRGEDVAKAIEKAAPGIVLSTVSAVVDQPKEPQKTAEAPAPVQVAGDATGIGLLLDQKFSPSDVEVSSRVVEGVRERVFEGFDNNGKSYRYSIITTPEGNSYYSYMDAGGQKQFTIADPQSRTNLESNLFSGEVGKRDPISGSLIIEVAGVGAPGEAAAPLPITAGLDLRQYVGAEGTGRAVIGRGGRGGSDVKSTFRLIGRDSSTGLDKFDIGGEQFTLLILPGNRQALVSDVRDVVFFPENIPDSNEVKLTEAPLETLIPETKRPSPADLPTGPAAAGQEGVTGRQGAPGGLPSLQEIRQREREELIDRIIQDELAQLDRDLAAAKEIQKISGQNVERGREQVARLTSLPERVRLSPAMQEILNAEISLSERAREQAGEQIRSLTTRKDEIGAVQQGKGEITDEDILSYLQTGRLPTTGGRGAEAGAGAGPAAGTGREGEGEGALRPGEGVGAGEEGEGIGGGGEGGAGEGGLQPRIRSQVIFNRLDLPESQPFASRVTGEALAGILGEKEPLFGGDEDEQQAVWNRRSLRLRKALGL
jgi:hypothetical protein